MIQAAGRRLFDALESRLADLALQRPRPALSAAAALGSVRNRLSRRWPSPEQVRTLFPALAPREAARVAWRIGALEARNRLLAEGIRRTGVAPFRPLVRTPPGSFLGLRPPLLLGTFHMGAMNVLGPALERLQGPVLVLRQSRLSPAGSAVEVVTTGGDDQSRAAAFQRALTHLEARGFVVSALDVTSGPGLGAPCLGRNFELARGPFALARLTGARIVPLAARWCRSEVEVAAGEALAPAPASESALAAAAAHWLEIYLLESPCELSLGLLRALLGSAGLRPPARGS